MRVVVSLLTLALASGCVDFGPARERVPGDLLGDYAVSGQLVTSSCGDGALGSTETWNFDVRLSRQGTELYWGNGAEVIRGEIDPETERFRFATLIAVELSPSKPPHAGCTMHRTDAADGELHGIGEDVDGFDATLTYGFAAAEGADCTAYVGAAGGVAELPCAMEYALIAERTEPAEGG